MNQVIKRVRLPRESEEQTDMLRSNNYEILRLFAFIMNFGRNSQKLSLVFSHSLISTFSQILSSFEQPSLASKVVTNKAIMISGEIVQLLSN